MYSKDTILSYLNANRKVDSASAFCSVRASHYEDDKMLINFVEMSVQQKKTY